MIKKNNSLIYAISSVIISLLLLVVLVKMHFVKAINIKNCTYYFFNDMISIKYLSQIKSYKNLLY